MRRGCFRACRSITAMLAHLGIKDYRRKSTRVHGGTAEGLMRSAFTLAPGRAILVVDSINVTPTRHADPGEPHRDLRPTKAARSRGAGGFFWRFRQMRSSGGELEVLAVETPRR